MSPPPKSRIIGLTVAALATVAGVSSAQAHYDGPDYTPNAPVVGDTGGLAGPGPQINVYGGAVRLRGGNTVEVGVECVTSTEMGCSGSLQLADAGGRRVASTDVELAEGQGEGVFLELPAAAKRRAARKTGWHLTATATGVDNLGRSATDTAAVRVWTRRGRKSR
jgi:hypothetical protein